MNRAGALLGIDLDDLASPKGDSVVELPGVDRLDGSELRIEDRWDPARDRRRAAGATWRVGDHQHHAIARRRARRTAEVRFQEKDELVGVTDGDRLIGLLEAHLVEGVHLRAPDTRHPLQLQREAPPAAFCSSAASPRPPEPALVMPPPGYVD